MKIRFLCLLLLLGVAPAARALDAGKASFTIAVKGEENPYTIFSVFVMPGETFPLSSRSVLEITSAKVTINRTSDLAYTLTAPGTSGLHTVSLRDMRGGSMTLNVLVLTPMEAMKGEHLNGYRIGEYPSTPLRGNPIYNKPQGLLEVTPTLAKLQLTPHFTLGQFLCKQAGDYPKFILVRERLLLKLEYLLQVVNAQGYSIDTFGFISGYRTPFYNKAIGNVQYSRHVWGGAADIIIDENNDGSLDDLNKDGRIDEADVQVFYDLVNALYGEPYYDQFIGGLGFYRKNSRHNGFIHVDVRGTKARW